MSKYSFVYKKYHSSLTCKAWLTFMDISSSILWWMEELFRMQMAWIPKRWRFNILSCIVIYKRNQARSNAVMNSWKLLNHGVTRPCLSLPVYHTLNMFPALPLVKTTSRDSLIFNYIYDLHLRAKVPWMISPSLEWRSRKSMWQSVFLFVHTS